VNKGDDRLLAYLYNNAHSTPFEFAGMVLEVQAPIFVFREWQRHRTQAYNEASARYSPLPDLNYLPSVERITATAGTNKQAQGTGSCITDALAADFRNSLQSEYNHQQALYLTALDRGVPKELARLVLPVGRYSKMRASTSLRNWLAFMTLRCDDKAQWEIRQYAWAVACIIEEKFPQTFRLWDEEFNSSR
jgi:thymidylate synthase (FAD)